MAVFVVSAMDVAVTVAVNVLTGANPDGAKYKPVVESVPKVVPGGPVNVQVTGVAAPAAVNCCEPFRATVADAGVTETAAGVGVGVAVGTGVGVGVGVGVPLPPPQATRPNRIRDIMQEAKILLINSSSLHGQKPIYVH